MQHKSTDDDSLRKEAWVKIKHKMATVKVPEDVTLEHLLWILFLLGEGGEI